MNQQEYNGWTNYETWLTTLWIGNEPYLDETIKELVAQDWTMSTASTEMQRSRSSYLS